MTFKDITVLALLLVIGLFFNRCAFRDDALDVRQAEHAADRVAKHAERIASDMEENMEEFGERMDQFGERMGERMDEIGERIDEHFDDTGEEPMEDAVEGANGDAEGVAKASKVTVSLTHGLTSSTEIDLALDIPVICDETTLDFGQARKSALGIIASGSGELQSPKISSVDSETIALTFLGETPSELTLELPRNIPYVRFKEPQRVKLALSKNTLLMKLDAAGVGSLRVARSKRKLTVEHSDWQLTITGISQPLALMGLDGEMLGRVESNKRGEVDFDFAPDENEGGAR